MAKSRTSIRLKGAAANSFVAFAMADSAGIKEKAIVKIREEPAAEGCIGIIETREASTGLGVTCTVTAYLNADGARLSNPVQLLLVPDKHLTPAMGFEAKVKEAIAAHKAKPTLDRAAAWGYVRNARAIASGERLASLEDAKPVLTALADLVANHLLGQHP